MNPIQLPAPPNAVPAEIEPVNLTPTPKPPSGPTPPVVVDKAAGGAKGGGGGKPKSGGGKSSKPKSAKTPTLPAGAGTPDEKDDEIARLRKRLAELENAPAPEVGPKPRFLVKLQHSPSWVVEAVSEAEAWGEYCKAANILRSDHKPEIMPTTDPVGRVV